MTRVVIAAGGTAGHVVPALAVADELRARGADVSFLGTQDRAEGELVPRAGYELDALRLIGLDRRNPLKAAVAAWRASVGVVAARRALRRRSAEVVLGAGGYVAGPVGVAALSMGLPLVLSEADSHLGLSNRLLARRARRVCLAFPIEGHDNGRYVVTGRPVPAALLSADRGAARDRFGIGADERCLLVFGGSQGARTLNHAAIAAFGDGERSRGFHVVHIAGSRDFQELASELRKRAPKDYTLLEQEPNLGEVLAACDLVVARSGGSIFELAATGRPAILVPYPHASGDHQTQNAAWMESAGAAVVIPDADVTQERLRSEVATLLSNPERLADMAKASAGLARPDAAARIAEEVLRVADGADDGLG